MARQSQTEATQKIQKALDEGADGLDLSGLGLTEVPESIAQLTKLKTLNLTVNQLTSLPEAIAQLTNLQTLELHNNKLISLPEAIAQLSLALL